MIYLDCAATTLQKPIAVSNAAAQSINHFASPGRGGHRPAIEAGEVVYRCREEAAKLFDVPNPEQVVFTFNATHGLNLAIKSLVKPGAVVLISGYEHNAVTRPLAAIPNVEIRCVRESLFDQKAFLERFEQEISCKVDVVVCTHVSNVFGYILPIQEIAKLCREHSVPLIIDASQSAGVLPISLKASGASFIAMPGHKGLYGPQGTGILLCNCECPETLIEGGTGSLSRRQTMPEFLPDRLEAGTHNVPGIAGLLEGIKFVRKTGVDTIFLHEEKLICYAAKRLRERDDITVFADEKSRCQSGVCSFVSDGMDCETVGNLLGERGIAVRAGLHCAPCAHQTVRTLESGTVRISVSLFNDLREIDCFVDSLFEILK